MKKIYKALLVIVSIFIVVGCGDMENTPTKKVEAFLSKYQNTDEEVLKQLDNTLDIDNSYSASQKEKYRDIIKNQYKNLDYKIKSETEDGNTATVVAEIEVFDLGKVIIDVDEYLSKNREEFVTDTKTDTIDAEKFLNYKLRQMEDAKEKVTYTINFTLTKKKGKWTLDDITDIDRLKLHGLYY